MTGEATPEAGSPGWDADVRALFFAAGESWDEASALGQALAALLLVPGETVGRELRDEVIAAALDHADAQSSDPRTDEDAAALREGVRGFFWLPEPGGRADSGLPRGEDVDLVANPTGFSRYRAQPRQRWAAIRYGRVKGVEYRTASSARTVGSRLRGELAARLVADLEAWFSNDDAVDSVAVGIASNRVQARFTAAPPLSSSLRERLRLVAASLGRVPHFYPEHLSVVALAEGRQIADLPEEIRPGGPAEQFYAKAPDAGDRYEALPTLEGEHRAVLLGDPGSGKSTLARAAVVGELHSSDRAVAVFVSASALARLVVSTGEAWQTAIARVALEVAGVPDPGEKDVSDLSELIASGKHVRVVLDGIDEVFDAAGRQVLDRVIAQLEGVSGRVLLTSRLIGYRPRPGWRALTTMPLVGAFPGLLEQWFQGTDRPGYNRAMEAYERDRDVQQLVRSPVLAGMVATLADQPGAVLDTDRSALYDQAVTFFCEQDWKHPGPSTREYRSAMALRRAYSRAAWTMAVGPGIANPSSWTTTTSYGELFDADIDADLIRSGDLLTAYGSPAALLETSRPWIWLHRSFADYLVARHLAALWSREPAVAEDVMRGAVQYPTAWTEPLRFFVELAPEAAMSALVRVARELCREGDPGGVVHTLMDDILPRLSRARRLFSTDGLGNGETAASFRVAEWLYAGGPEPALDDFRADIENAGKWLHALDPAGAIRQEIIRQGLERAGRYLPNEIVSALTPSERVALAQQRIADPGRPAVVDVSVDLTYAETPGTVAAWMEQFRALYAERRFPETIRVAETLREYTPALGIDPADEEFRLALWAAQAVSPRGKIPESVVAGPLLRKRVFRGEWGPWAALNAGFLDPEAALRCRGAVTHAAVGARIQPLLSFIPTPPPPGPRPEDLAEVFGSFGAGDLEDIEKVAALLDRLAYVNDTLPDADVRALLLLISRLGGVPEKGKELQTLAIGCMVYDERGLGDLLRAVFWRLLSGSDTAQGGVEAQGRFEALALELWRERAPVTVLALAGFALEDETPAHRRRAVDLVEFALATGPSRLGGHVEILFQEASTEFAEQLLERYGPHIAAIPGFFSQLVWGFGWAGTLAAKRQWLLELQRGTD